MKKTIFAINKISVKPLNMKNSRSPRKVRNGKTMVTHTDDKYGGEILFHVNENVSSTDLHLNSTPDDNEVILLEFSIDPF